MELECIRLRLLALEARTRDALRDCQSQYLGEIRVMLKKTLNDAEAALELVNAALKKGHQ